MKTVLMLMVMLVGAVFGEYADFGTATDLLDGTYSCSSISYLDGVEYAPNKPRWIESVPVVGYSGLTIPTVHSGAGIRLIVQCKAGQYLYAVDTTAEASGGRKGLFRSSDGITWTQIQSTTALTNIHRVFGRADGTLYAVMNDKVDGINRAFYRSTTGGADWVTASLPTDADHRVIEFDNTIDEAVELWGWNDTGSEILLTTYHSTASTKRVWRSTDGITFTVVYTEAGGGIIHGHATGYHSYTGKRLVGWGDGAQYNKVTYSDDGTTWTDLDTNTTQHWQPIAWLDYGHKSKILFGSDSVWGLGTADVTTGALEQTMSHPQKLSPYVFDIFYSDGVYYAAVFQTSNTTTLPADLRISGIWVSDNLEQWIPYHTFRANELGCWHFIGELGGKIHGLYRDASENDYHYYINKALITRKKMLAIDPAVTNLMNVKESSMESAWDGTYKWAASDTTDAILEQSTTYAYDGTTSLHYTDVTSPTNAYIYARSVGGDIDIGEVANISFYYRIVTGNHGCQAKIYFNVGSVYSPPFNFGAKPGEWQLFKASWAPTGDNSYINMFVYPHMSAYITGNFDFYLDAAQMVDGPPSRYQVGGTPRTIGVMSKTVTYPAAWTEAIHFVPYGNQINYASTAGEQYIKTWYIDANNYVELYWLPSDKKFKLKETLAGSAQTAVSSVNTYEFAENQPFTFIVRCAGQAMTCNLYTGGETERIILSTGTSYTSKSVVSKTGNAAGSTVISGSLCNYLYNSKWSDDETLVYAVSSGQYGFDITKGVQVTPARSRYDYPNQ
jgi:hypothetical protein